MGVVHELDPAASPRYQPYLTRFRAGEWRATVLRDMIREDALASGASPALLDIGCGLGFDDSIDLQKSLASVAGRFVGIEPDPAVEIGHHVNDVHRCTLEQAPIPPDSIDLAYAIMVLEHLETPQVFWDKVHEILRPGGIFWALTVDGRHPFSWASYWSERIGIKEGYMRLLNGKRGEERYLNYPVHYRSNTPAQVERYAGKFASCEVMSLSRVGQMRAAFPAAMGPLLDKYDAWTIRTGRSGTNLVVRAVKAI